MKIVPQGWTWYTVPLLYRDMVFAITGAARNCYQSDMKPLEEEEQFIRKLIKRGHLSPLEHVTLSLKITTDRGVLAELTRHRLSSYSVESTRFVKYQGDIEFILPVWFEHVEFEDTDGIFKCYLVWHDACLGSEEAYKILLSSGQSPQQARQVLNMSLKTEIIMSSNLRQWGLILQQRTAKEAHPQMVALMTSILKSFKQEFPVFFEDI